ncbi:MAG TPA: TIGR01777 family oxidoreductase [Blastocatellia bacterium]|nr:TIGR01777 family oxidoreductase [Blastocatellia bacterium]
MKVLVTGATGLIGRELCDSLSHEGHRVVALSRSPETTRGLAADEVHKWEPMSSPPPAQALNEIDAVVHLVGEPIADRRWTDSQKKLIRDSRILSTRNLVAGLGSVGSRPSALINGSAVGFYGDRGDEQLDETASMGRGFMSEICRDWENEAAAARELGIRVVQVRTGVVLSPQGGALKKMVPPFKLGVGGRLGSGRQWFPWIHIADIVGIFRHAISDPSLKGPANGVAPESVTNAVFTKQLGRALHRPAFLPVPEMALRALMGEMADVLFHSQRVVPKAVLQAGYVFRYPALAQALEDLFSECSGDSTGR